MEGLRKAKNKLDKQSDTVDSLRQEKEQLEKQFEQLEKEYMQVSESGGFNKMEKEYHQERQQLLNILRTTRRKSANSQKVEQARLMKSRVIQ